MEMAKYLSNVHDTQEWLKCVSYNGGWEVQEKSLAALRATLHFLREKLPAETSSYLEAQLPPMIREMYNKGSISSRKNPRVKKNFLESIEEYLKPRTDIEAEEAAYAVFKTLAYKIPKEIVSKVKNKLPHHIQSYWD